MLAVHGQDDDGDLGQLLGQLARQRQAVHLRHADVEQDHVGRELANDTEGFRAIGSLADNLEIRL